MTAFSDIETKRPPGNVVVPPSAFASTWAERPDEDVCIGLRFVADVDLEDARIEAFKRADKLVPNHGKTDEASQLFVASFQDTLVRWIIGRGTCDTNNVRAPWSPWEAAPEDMPRETLTDQGAQLIFDAWERMRIASDIGLPAASDEDIAMLPELLARLPKLNDESRARALRVRRLLRFVLEELESVPAPQVATPVALMVTVEAED